MTGRCVYSGPNMAWLGEVGGPVEIEEHMKTSVWRCITRDWSLVADLVHFGIDTVAFYIYERIVHVAKGPSKTTFLAF